MSVQQKSEPALRYDEGKARYDLIPADVLDALAVHYGKGAKKYSDNNWAKGMSFGRCFGSLMRHAWAFWRGEEIDPETGSHHMISAAWNCFALAAYSFRGVGTDDRPAAPDVPDEHEEGELLWSDADEPKPKPDTADPAYLDAPLPDYMTYKTCDGCPTPVLCKTKQNCRCPLPFSIELSRDCP